MRKLKSWGYPVMHDCMISMIESFWHDTGQYRDRRMADGRADGIYHS